LGLNVTVPHKIAVMKYLDALDETAKQSGAVNTIVRRPDGDLYGANTDGAGFIATLLTPGAGEKSPLLKSLDGIDVLVLGAGGSARAVAFALAEKIGGGRIVIGNRSYENARRLAQEISRQHGNASAIREEEIPAAAPGVKLIVNCTIKGQGGIAGAEGAFEDYSALAPTPATPAEAARRENIDENHRISMEIAHAVPRETIFYDLIYYPEETVFMRHARATGHRTTNGRGMIVAQAVESFFSHICRQALEKAGLHKPETRVLLREAMDGAWG
jgi:shikimate dehydrogenase